MDKKNNIEALEKIIKYYMKNDLFCILLEQHCNGDFSTAYLTMKDMQTECEFGTNPETLLENIGLEPDYIFDIINFIPLRKEYENTFINSTASGIAFV